MTERCFQFLEAKRNPEFRTSPRMSALQRSTFRHRKFYQ